MSTPHQTGPDRGAGRGTTHRDLVPPGMCPALMMKHVLIHAMDEQVHDDRAFPGDGYYWCLCTSIDVGPDDEIVHPSACTPARACYDGPRA